MAKVINLKIGDKIKFHNAEVYVVGWSNENGTKALLNKNKNGVGMFSISIHSHLYEDLCNRVEVVLC